MGGLFGSGWLIVLIAVTAHTEAQKTAPTNKLDIRSKCLGNLLRLDVGSLGGKLLEVAFPINNSIIPLTPRLGSQCGFSIRTDPLGNSMIFASLRSCFSQHMGNSAMTALTIRPVGNKMVEEDPTDVTETCPVSSLSSREIICERNYMEVSVKREAANDFDLPAKANSKFVDPRRAAEKTPLDAGFRIVSVAFYTPDERVMAVAEAQSKGYGVGNVASRLVVRGSQAAPETFVQDVAGVPMTVLQTSVTFKKKFLTTRINAAAACPTLEGSVVFSPETITWYLPIHIDPLIASQQIRLMEVHMGVDGERLDVEETAARGYGVTVNDVHVVVQIPIGAVGGHYKSYVQDDQYLTSYTIEPMLELLWIEDVTHEDTRYKVLFPISTPLQPPSQSPQVTDNTIPGEEVFKVVVGPFASDVALMNITFHSGVLSIAECVARGFNVLEHTSLNGVTKIFSLEVPFRDRVVGQMKGTLFTVYTLPLTFGLVVLPEFAPFSYSGYVEKRVDDSGHLEKQMDNSGHLENQVDNSGHLEKQMDDKIAPSITGGCDHENFYVLVKYGTPGFNFHTFVGKRVLTQSLIEQFNFRENGTHMSLAVPFMAHDVAFEALEAMSIRGRLDVTLRNPQTNRNINEYTLACNFPTILTECYPDGTITARAAKLESVPGLILSQLTLRDPSCGPTSSDDRFAYFTFTANSCGTTRKFLPNGMLYENEISVPDAIEAAKQPESEQSQEPEYELMISCFYDIGATHAVAYHTRPRRSEPYAENANGELQVEIKLALDDSFSKFHQPEQFPLDMYLQQPMYVEIELMKSTNPRVSVEVENCWATLKENRTSQPRWDLIIDGCANPVDPHQVIFHPVWPDARVQYPPHFKRFEVQAFAFTEDQELRKRLFVHCDVVICDATNALSGVCAGGCQRQGSKTKGQRRAVPDKHTTQGAHRTSTVPIGPISFNKGTH